MSIHVQKSLYFLSILKSTCKFFIFLGSIPVVRCQNLFIPFPFPPTPPLKIYTLDNFIFTSLSCRTHTYLFLHTIFLLFFSNLFPDKRGPTYSPPGHPLCFPHLFPRTFIKPGLRST